MKLHTFLLASTLLCAGFARTATASDGPPESRLILRLSDGTRVRGPAREVAGGFEVKNGERWRLIERDSVIAVRAERDALAERRTMLDGIPPNRLGARVEACSWMIDQGLDAEATEELDRILRAVPDERHVLLLLATTPPRIDLGVKPDPDGSLRAPLLREGARTCNIGASAVRRELVVKALGATAPREPVATSVVTAETARPAQPRPLRDELVDELGSSVIARRTFACLALRRLYPATTIGPLAVHAVLDPSVDVRDEAILSLREAHDPKACGVVVQALANPSGLVRQNALEALGRMGYPEAVEPLIKLMIAANAAAAAGGGGGGGVRSNLFVGLQTAYVQDFNVEIAQAASIADPIVNVLQSGVMFDVTVGGVSTVPITTEIWTAASSLVRLTGARIGADPPAWEKWWNANRDKYVPGAKRGTGTRDD